MDPVGRYRAIVQGLLREIGDACERSRRADGRDDIQTHCIFDAERDHYLLVSTVRGGSHHNTGYHIYIRIADGKVRIEDDWTDGELVEDLLAAGIPREDIILSWQEKRPQPHSDAVPV